MSIDARWLRIKELFQQSQQLPETERVIWLTRECSDDPGLFEEVAALLAAQSASPGIFANGAVGIIGQLHGEEFLIDRVGQRIGGYRLLRLIGEGGMGSVYLADREIGDFSQQVALKLIRADFISDQTRERFSRERSFLARLIHRHIAQLHDGGVAEDGTPYFTLEYVDGEPITKYCDARALTIRERLELTIQVCAAISYAHRNLIVHRDLKPSNILVTADGDVKLLDFGIAKLLDARPDHNQTVTQARMMTPEYAAPEQVLGEPITTATDVYAIGVLLYELLCGRLPYARADAGLIGWSKAVMEETPESLDRALGRSTGKMKEPTGQNAAAARGMTFQTLRRALRGDPDRIIQRALAKEPESRYPSVEALADDLRALADGRAISGGGRRYRLHKFVRRHWMPLAAAASIFLILLLSGAAIFWQARKTEYEARTTRAVKEFLYGLFTAVDPREAKGREVSAHELLDRGAKGIGRNQGLDPAQKAEIEAVLGRIYFQLGLFNQANALQDDAIKSLTDDFTQPLLLAQTEAERSETLLGLGDPKSALLFADAARAGVDAQPDAPVIDRARALAAQSRVALDQRDFSLAMRLADAELALVRRADVDPHILYRALSRAGGASWGLSRLEDAEAYYREAYAVASRDATPDDLDVANARSNIGLVLRSRSQFAEALEMEQQALATNERVLGPDHPQTLLARRELGLANFHLGYYAKAREALQETLSSQLKTLGNDHPALAGTEINLGLVLIEIGDMGEAERVLTDALNTFQKKYGREYPGTQVALGDLAVIHMLQGDLPRAEKELMEVKGQEEKLDDATPGNFVTLNRLGEVRRQQGNATAAINLERTALAATQAANGESSRYTAMTHHWLALALRDQGDIGGAERELRAALASFAGYIPQGEHPLAATSRYELGMMLIKRKADRAEGLAELTEAATLREKFLGKNDPRTLEAHEALTKATKLSN